MDPHLICHGLLGTNISGTLIGLTISLAETLILVAH